MALKGLIVTNKDALLNFTNKDALLNLCSRCHIMVEWLFLAVPWGCLGFMIVVFPDHTHYFCMLQTGPPQYYENPPYFVDGCGG